MNDWKDGDLADVMCSDGVWRMAFYDTNYRGRWWRFADGGFRAAVISSARPLVVIDPEDAEQVDALTKAIVEAAHTDGNFTVSNNGIHPDTTQRALREFTTPTPPRIVEPAATGSIVTAHCVHSKKRARWIKGFDGNWWREDRVTYGAQGSNLSQPDDWDSLIDPEPAS